MAKRALVTGARAGMGMEWLKQLAADGWSVTGVARSEDHLTPALKELPNAAEHKALAADLSTQHGVNKVVEELKATKYQLLVNNAGVGLFGRFEKESPEKLI